MKGSLKIPLGRIRTYHSPGVLTVAKWVEQVLILPRGLVQRAFLPLPSNRLIILLTSSLHHRRSKLALRARRDCQSARHRQHQVGFVSLTKGKIHGPVSLLIKGK